MLLKESKKLKLNVTRLHSYLVSSNKKLKKLRLEETSFLRKLEVERKRKLKESKIEAPTKTTRIDKIKKRDGPLKLCYLQNRRSKQCKRYA